MWSRRKDACATSAPPLRHLATQFSVTSYCDFPQVPNIPAPPVKYNRCKEMVQITVAQAQRVIVLFSFESPNDLLTKKWAGENFPQLT